MLKVMSRKIKSKAEMSVDIATGLGRMRRWYKCQEIAKCLYDSTTSDVEVDLLLQQAETGMFENKGKF